ncbi:MAG TPA: MBL fold metallo-hydrolase [Solirubrobacteraceae bacterium]|nr:MBL fold metallo-hydrolase [Solirubrobacteraceae bacterium]
MRAQALHPDVLLVTSAVLALNCVVVRAELGEPAGESEGFLIDSPVLPEELDSLPGLLGQAGFPEPDGLLATHGDWDHLLGRLAFPELALGCAESTIERLDASPGEAQRELRAFDEELYIERPGPLALGSLQALPVPGRLDIGDREIELHPTGGHTVDGMALLVGWAGVLAVGDYLSPIEIPTISPGGNVEAYLQTLGRLRGLLERVEHVIPGHGPRMDAERARSVLDEDVAYLEQLSVRGEAAALPAGRRGAEQRRLHARNVASVHAADAQSSG